MKPDNFAEQIAKAQTVGELAALFIPVFEAQQKQITLMASQIEDLSRGHEIHSTALVEILKTHLPAEERHQD